MTGVWLYSVTGALLALSFARDRERSVRAIRMAAKQLAGLASTLVAIVLFVGLTLAVLDPSTISAILGKSSGPAGVVVGLAAGSVAFMPSFVAFPMAAALLAHGAAYPQVGAFLATLMGISVSTLPLELRYFGKKVVVMRNLLCLFTAIVFVAALAKVMGR